MPYDFRRPTKVSREHVRVLQLAYETFARRLTTLLTSGLRQVCQVSLDDIHQITYEEYASGLANPTMLVPLTISPLPGTGILQFSLPVALAAIDHLLGGPGGQQVDRPLTDIETGLLRGLIDQMVRVLTYAMEPIVVLEPAIGAIEYNPPFLQAAGPAEAMTVAEFTMMIADEQCPLTIAIPVAGLLPRLVVERAPRAGATSSGVDDLRNGEALHRHLADLPLTVSLRFDDLLITPSAILGLAVGDIIPIRHRVGAPLTVHAAGVHYATAIAGKAGNRLAALVVEGSPTTSKEQP